MNIPATELKQILKKLSPIRTETFHVGPHGLSAQDSDAWVVADWKNDLGETFGVSGKKFSQVVNRMSGNIEITREERKIVLKSAKAKIELEVLPVKPLVFPELGENFIKFGPDFKKAVSVASNYASPNKSAAYGGCVQIKSLPLKIDEEISSGYSVVGTDGNVLSLINVDENKPNFYFLLNLESASIVQLMDNLEIADTNKNLQIRGNGVVLYASKSSQVYPNFDSFTTLNPKIVLQFDPENWLSAVKTIEPLIDDDKGLISLQFKENVVTFSNVGVGSTAQDEAAYDQIDPDVVFEPQSFTTRLSAKYLSGFLSKAKNPATLNLTSSDKPVRFESDGVSIFTMAFKKKAE